MQIPTQDNVTAMSFIAFMETVWGGDTTPNADGGLTMWQSPLYDRWHNAVITAKRFGAIRTGATKIHGDDWTIYMFPNGDRVAIAKHGGGVTEPVQKEFHRRRMIG